MSGDMNPIEWEKHLVDAERANEDTILVTCDCGAQDTFHKTEDPTEYGWVFPGDDQPDEDGIIEGLCPRCAVLDSEA